MKGFATRTLRQEQGMVIRRLGPSRKTFPLCWNFGDMVQFVPDVFRYGIRLAFHDARRVQHPS